MSDQRLKKYLGNLQTKLPSVSGVARAVVLDSNTGQQRYTDVEVGTQIIRINLDSMAPRIAGGDVLRLEQTGTAANAEYRLVGVSGSRPTSGILQFMDDTTGTGIGGIIYAGGDILIGGTGASDPNFFYDFSAGIWQARTGATVNGSWASDGTIISGAVAGPNVQITSTAVNIRQAAVNAINLTAADGIRMYAITGGTPTQKVAINPDGSGWFVASNKISWATDGTVSIAGNLSAGTIDIGGSDASSFHVDANGNLWLGDATYAGAPFQVSNAGALTATGVTVTGAVNASSGTFSGLVQIGSGTPHLHLDGATALLESSNYWVGVAGWRIAADGSAEFGNVKVRGSIQASVFEYQTLSAFAGGFVVAKSAGKTASAYTVGGTLTIETPAAGGWTFATNDIIRIKAVNNAGVGDTWITVTRTGTTNVYTTTYQSGDPGIGGVYPAGTACVDYGVSGQGLFAIAADGTFGASAAWVLQSHAGAPWTTTTTHVYAGTDGKLYAGGGNVTLDTDGISLKPTSEYIRWLNTSGTRLGTIYLSPGSDAPRLVFQCNQKTSPSVDKAFVEVSAYDSDSSAHAYLMAGAKDDDVGISIIADNGLATVAGITVVNSTSRYITYDAASHTFEGYLVAAAMRPAADSTTALQLQNAAGTAKVTIDTTNGRVGIGATPDGASLHIVGAGNHIRLAHASATHGFVGVGSNSKLYIADWDTGAYGLAIDLTNGNTSYVGNLTPYRNSTNYTGYIFVPLTSPLTSTSWDGDAFSTTSKTVIDLSSVFSAPAGIKAALIRTTIRDSGASGTDCYLILSPNSTSGSGLYARCPPSDDRYASGTHAVPCDASGDIYYQTVASGSGTLDVIMEIWGYWI